VSRQEGDGKIISRFQGASVSRRFRQWLKLMNGPPFVNLFDGKNLPFRQPSAGTDLARTEGPEADRFPPSLIAGSPQQKNPHEPGWRKRANGGRRVNRTIFRN
jgi:hypothetical protein